jgi:hypothetical protein
MRHRRSSAPASLRVSWGYVAFRSVVVVAGGLAVVGLFNGWVAVLQFSVVSAAWGVFWALTGRRWDGSSITNGRIRGASSVGGWRSRPPPALAEIDAVYLATHMFARVVIVEVASAGEKKRWRLDGPRSLRWGTSAEFNADYHRVQSLWDKARRLPNPSDLDGVGRD